MSKDLIQQAAELLDNPDASAQQFNALARDVSLAREQLSASMNPGKPAASMAASMDDAIGAIEAENRRKLEVEALGRCFTQLKAAERRARAAEAAAGFDDAQASLVAQADHVAALERQLAEARTELGEQAKRMEQRRQAAPGCTVDGETADRIAALVHPTPDFAPAERSHRTTVRRQLAG
ncbi:hypothetical protein [Halomonas salipaludis]|uniref:Uncharacterized protein n=1 Tax=Halomonas salipaludis TaxID=2032625 RepID=A0A2A2EZX9_9GAMM|nr:hypothetical protein [Halomonas salipaludis]PAU78931.1 hypothetical protein CK498_00675 [Halomonas salipaludis]